MERLKELRKEKKLTQTQVGNYLGITVSAYGNYELGQREPSIDMLLKLADYFGVTVDYLLGRETNTATSVEPLKTKNSSALSEEDEAMLNQYLELSEDSKRAVRYTVDMYERSEAQSNKTKKWNA